MTLSSIRSINTNFSFNTFYLEWLQRILHHIVQTKKKKKKRVNYLKDKRKQGEVNFEPPEGNYLRR